MELQVQKTTLEKKLSEMNSSLKEMKKNLQIKEETCLILEKEKKSLQKSFEKVGNLTFDNVLK